MRGLAHKWGVKSMRRRSFFKMMAGTATAVALPAGAGRALAHDVAASAFDRIGQTYARFCATPEMQRVFHALRGKAITKERPLSERAIRKA